MSDAIGPTTEQLHAALNDLADTSAERYVAETCAAAVLLLRERDAEIARLQKRLGNILDHYEQLPNDIKVDSGFANLRRALDISCDEEVRGE